MDRDDPNQSSRLSAYGRATQIHRRRNAQRTGARGDDPNSGEWVAHCDDARWSNRRRLSKIGHGRPRRHFLARAMPPGTKGTLHPAQPMTLDVNCDLGEGEPLELTEALMRQITSAN